MIYIIENNQYAMGTSVERFCPNGLFYNAGVSFGIDGVQVDGMDIEQVYDAACKARAHVMSGAGPIILEMKTYRYSGHSMSDPAKYRKREEVKEMRQHHDLIKLLQARLVERRGLLTEAEIKSIDQQMNERIDAVVAAAEASSEPDMSELTTDIYVETNHAG